MADIWDTSQLFTINGRDLTVKSHLRDEGYWTWYCDELGLGGKDLYDGTATSQLRVCDAITESLLLMDKLAKTK